MSIVNLPGCPPALVLSLSKPVLSPVEGGGHDVMPAKAGIQRAGRGVASQQHARLRKKKTPRNRGTQRWHPPALTVNSPPPGHELIQWVNSPHPLPAWR